MLASSVSQNVAPEPLAEDPLPTVTVTTTTTTHAGTNETSHDSMEDEAPRPQAGPLPKKRGEIGFVEGVDDVPEVQAQAQARSSSSTLPERHPADRSRSTSPDQVAAPAVPTGEPPRSPSRAESTDTTGKRSFISFLRPKRIPTVLGLRLTTLAILFLQLSLFGATIAGWVLTIQHLQKTSSNSSSSSPSSDSSSSSSDDNSNTQSGTTNPFSSTSAQIFIHVAFAIVALAELIFIERSVFRLRAERYAHVHPGEILPSARRNRASQEMGMGFAPWNRPPLPTYAAALAQSGIGTGDVEDNIIAIPPPPAYGNTRGSTLLLAGFLSDALRAQRPRSGRSVQSRSSAGSDGRRGSGVVREEGDRPKSYMSTDPEWEARCDADRALFLEETLARLEDTGVEVRRS